MPPLSATAHIRRLRGGSQSHLLLASDGHLYVTKFQNNPQHLRVLVNEMFATRLGQRLRLPMPRVAVIEVPDWLIERTPELCHEVAGHKSPCSTGRQLGSRYLEKKGAPVFDWLPEAALADVKNLRDFARVLVLDKWTCNSDGRQTVFTRSRRRYAASFIDQGYAFNAGEWTFPDSPLRGTSAWNSVYQQVLGWDSFEPTLTLAEEMPDDTLWGCVRDIPEEWYEHDRDALTRLVEALHRRRKLIRSLIDAFRNSSRNPFPNWQDRSRSVMARPACRSTDDFNFNPNTQGELNV